MDKRVCGTCRHFEPGLRFNEGWCRNPRLFGPGQSQPVSAASIWCASDRSDFWEPSEFELGIDYNYPVEVGNEPTESASSVDGGGSASTPDPLTNADRTRGVRPAEKEQAHNSGSTDDDSIPQARSARQEFETVQADHKSLSADSPTFERQEQRVSYQEERYWTDYLRIALPIVGLLLLLGVFWFWANSFIGDDSNNNDETPAVAIQTTAITAPTSTPTTSTVVQITPENVQPTQPAVATTGAEVETPEPTAPSEPTDTGAGTGGVFAEGDSVVVTDDNVNMRSGPSTSDDVVDTFQEGTTLDVVSGTPEEADGYIWWNVSDPLGGTEGWIVQEFLDTAS